MKVSELAELLAAKVEGDGQRELQRVAPLEEAGAADLSFVTREKTSKGTVETSAGCLLVPEDFANSSGLTVIRVRDPRAAVAKAISALHPVVLPEAGIHPTAVVGRDVELGQGCSIGPFV